MVLEKMSGSTHTHASPEPAGESTTTTPEAPTSDPDMPVWIYKTVQEDGVSVYIRTCRNPGGREIVQTHVFEPLPTTVIPYSGEVSVDLLQLEPMLRRLTDPTVVITPPGIGDDGKVTPATAHLSGWRSANPGTQNPNDTEVERNDVEEQRKFDLPKPTDTPKNPIPRSVF